MSAPTPFEENTLKRHAQALLASLTCVASLSVLAQSAPPSAPATTPPTTTPAQPAQPSPVEPMAPMGQKQQRMSADKFAAVDTNHDGAISREEAAAAPKLSGVFDQIDADHDGRLLPAELKAYAKTHRGSKGEMGQKAAKPGRDFSTFDTNHDGVITRDEVAGNPKAMKRFEAADADRDGRVTMQEAQAIRAPKP
jgi:Ca2+-binding EF-hand superfamily protein